MRFWIIVPVALMLGLGCSRGSDNDAAGAGGNANPDGGVASAGGAVARNQPSAAVGGGTSSAGSDASSPAPVTPASGGDSASGGTATAGFAGAGGSRVDGAAGGGGGDAVGGTGGSEVGGTGGDVVGDGGGAAGSDQAGSGGAGGVSPAWGTAGQGGAGLGSAGAGGSAGTTEGTWLSREEVLQTMVLANQYFMNKYPDPGADIVEVGGWSAPSNIWTRATYYEGLLALYGIYPLPAYYDHAVAWGEAHSWQIANLENDPRNADNQTCGQVYIDLYNYDPQPERIADITVQVDAMVASDRSDDWWWIDAIQMAMPVFVKLGLLYGDSAYFEQAYDLFSYTMTQHGDAGLYNPDAHLWWRDEDFDPPYTTPNGEDCYWSRGNGWVFAGLARVLDELPADEPHRAEYIQIFSDMAEALRTRQRSDGFWNVSLDDPDDYGGPELTGTSFFAYGMAWGINHGLLDAAVYRPVVERAWEGLVSIAVHPDGRLGYVQGTGKQPSDRQPVTYDSSGNIDDYPVGCFLLAGSEVIELATGEMPTP